MFTKIAPGIFSVSTRFVDGTNGIIFGGRGALAVDVGFHVDEGDATAAFIRERGCQPNRVILTHGHSDHVLGGASFQGAEVYAHRDTPDEIRRQLKGFAANQNMNYDDLLARALFPTVRFADELFIDLGDKQVRAFYTPGHSLDHISLYIEPDRVLFAGDNVVTSIVPAIGSGDSRLLERSLRQLTELPIAVLAAGHGHVLHGGAVIQEWLRWQIDYLSGMRAVIHAALQTEPNLSRERLAVLLPFDRWVGQRLPAERNHMPRRHLDTAAKIAAEETAALKEGA